MPDAFFQGQVNACVWGPTRFFTPPGLNSGMLFIGIGKNASGWCSAWEGSWFHAYPDKSIGVSAEHASAGTRVLSASTRVPEQLRYIYSILNFPCVFLGWPLTPNRQVLWWSQLFNSGVSNPAVQPFWGRNFLVSFLQCGDPRIGQLSCLTPITVNKYLVGGLNPSEKY